MIADLLMIALKISIIIYMAGILLDMGLRLNIRDAFAGIKNFRFVAHSLLWGFLIVPGIAWLTTIIFPLAQSILSSKYFWIRLIFDFHTRIFHYM